MELFVRVLNVTQIMHDMSVIHEMMDVFVA